MRLLEYIKLIRPQQWYKNLVIFLPLIFVGQFFNFNELLLTFVGAVALSLMSSVSYVINDIVDRKKDALHPEKKVRPLASGKVSVTEGIVIAMMLFLISLFISLKLSTGFAYMVMALFISSLSYSFIFKKEAFADILVIGVNFVIRAISGTFIINVNISPWLVLCTFFLSLFLSVGKRGSDLVLLGKDASKSRETLAHYTKEGVNALMILATALLIISYSLYSFLSDKKGLLLTLPFALYVIFRYFYLVYQGSPIARKTELVFKDSRLLIGGLLWALSAFLVLYWHSLF
jgi:4-hydroxybenzoate polyprenyltransferase